jgi:drug/metabolite transporter (DMT)-like permease
MPQRFLLAPLALATILWGANFNLAKHVLDEVPPLAAAAARFDIAALVMLLICAARGERFGPWRHLRVYAGLGLIGIAAFNVLFFLGMRSTSAVNGALIMGANPLLTALLAHFVAGASLRARQWLAMPIALAGVAFTVTGAAAQWHVAFGDLLMIGGSLCWALYNVCVGLYLPRDVSGLANTTGVMTAGAVALTAVAIAAGDPVQAPHAGALGSLLFMSLGGSVLAYLFWNAGVSRIGAARAAVFMNLVPVSSMAIAALEGQAPSAAQALGAVIVVGALLMASWPSQASLAPAAQAQAEPRALRDCNA